MITNTHTTLSLVGDDNVPLFTSRYLATIDCLPENATRLDKKGISQFNQLFSLVPQTSSALAAHSKHIVHCNIELDKLILRKDGTGSLGITRNPNNGQFTEHVSLNSADKLKNVVNTGLLLNIASTIVAQKHLADINEKLEEIAAVVNEIHEFQKNERGTKIAAFHKMLCLAGATLAKGENVSPLTLQTLSNSKQEIHGIALHLKKDFTASVEKLRQFDSTSLFGSDAIRQKLQDAINGQSRLFKEYMLSMQCLLMANLVLYYQDDFRAEFKDEAEQIMSELTASDGIESTWKLSQQKIKFQLSRMKPLFERKISTDANARLVEIHVKKAGDLLASSKELLTTLNQRLELAPVGAFLEIENGRVVGGVLATSHSTDVIT